MANLTTAAGDNGVAGSCTPAELITQIDAITGSVSGGDLSSTETTAVRSSVARTAFDSASTPSNVYSVTQGLRFAYSGVEADAAPGAITRT
tara:strand:+ start:134 stop:406 length:273 start_codon:yes stop_codon:yes gene_type:complete